MNVNPQPNDRMYKKESVDILIGVSLSIKLIGVFIDNDVQEKQVLLEALCAECFLFLSTSDEMGTVNSNRS